MSERQSNADDRVIMWGYGKYRETFVNAVNERLNDVFGESSPDGDIQQAAYYVTPETPTEGLNQGQERTDGGGSIILIGRTALQPPRRSGRDYIRAAISDDPQGHAAMGQWYVSHMPAKEYRLFEGQSVQDVSRYEEASLPLAGVTSLAVVGTQFHRTTEYWRLQDLVLERTPYVSMGSTEGALTKSNLRTSMGYLEQATEARRIQDFIPYVRTVEERKEDTTIHNQFISGIDTALATGKGVGGDLTMTFVASGVDPNLAIRFGRHQMDGNASYTLGMVQGDESHVYVARRDGDGNAVYRLQIPPNLVRNIGEVHMEKAEGLLRYSLPGDASRSSAHQDWRAQKIARVDTNAYNTLCEQLQRTSILPPAWFNLSEPHETS